MKNLTKGNWIFSEGQIYQEETGETFALIPYYDKDDKEQEANGKLMAASKEMLMELIEIKEYINKMGVVSMAMRVIKSKCNDAINNAQ